MRAGRNVALAILYLCSLLCTCAATLREAVVGNVRVQALSPSLLRVEPKGPKGFEDRTTFMVASRDFTGLNITTKTTDAGTVFSTDSYEVLVRGDGNAPQSNCNSPVAGTDVTAPVRSAKFPDGAKGAHSAAECCAACGTDDTCVAWIFVESFGGCYPLSGYGGTVKVDGRMFGGRGGTCSAAQSADVSGPIRSSKFPNGAPASNAGECCDQCKTDPTCVAYVFAESFKGCYPLAGYTGTMQSQGHTFAAVSQGGSAGPSFRVTSLSGDVLFDTDHDDRGSRLHWPSPLSKPAYGLMDRPRFFTPEWGVAPIPEDAHVDPTLRNSNGYDFDNQVVGDTYVFLLGKDTTSYNAARTDFIKLTGPTPVLPDYAYGTWFTFWHAYSQDEAKQDVEQWEKLQLPLDIWGLDINWRGVNWPDTMHAPNQCDYDHPDTSKFPDFDGWFQWLKEHKLRTYHNDHPCAQGPQAGPQEVEYRYDGLTKWLSKGMTFWWYDMNWYLGIPPPFRTAQNSDWEGLDTPAWGSHVFWTVTSYFDEHVLKPRGDDWFGKPMALSKSFNPDWVAGMDPIQGAEHPSHHRYPVHWTGDSVSLQASVESMVDAGLHSFKPYVHSDCGGDYGQEPGYDVTSAGGLLRWTGHCAYGSILRFHGADHRVWQYDEATQTAFRNYLTARHKLIPTILSAAQRTTKTGHPLVARLDLEWPEHKESASNSQYLFLDDILVAPIFDSHTTSRSVWIPPGQWQDAWDPASVVTGPQTITASQPNERIPMWHRRDGGLMILAHQPSTRVETQDWSSLSIEAFPSSAARNSTRRLFERSSLESTHVEMHTDGMGRVYVMIGEAPSAREWIVRLNLRPGEELQSARVDGIDLESVAHLHLEAATDRYFPLMGAGASPPVGAGPVAELHLSKGSHARAVEAVIKSTVATFTV